MVKQRNPGSQKKNRFSPISLEQESLRVQVHWVDQAWRVYCYSCIPTIFSSGLLTAWRAAERFYAEGFGFLFDNTSLCCPCVLSESCSLKESHLKGYRKRFQFPKGTSIRLPCLGEKDCNFAHGEVCFYEANFLCGLRFPIHPFIMQVLDEFQIALGQLVPNAWRTIISCMSIWLYAYDGEMITLNEFLYLYHLKASTHYGYFKLLSWDRKSRVLRGFPYSFRDWKSQYFFVSGKGQEVPRLLQKWEVPALGAYLRHSSLLLFIVWVLRLMNLFF